MIAVAGCNGLEPILEEFAGKWPAKKRRAIAKIWKRWTHQLIASADAMDPKGARKKPAFPVALLDPKLEKIVAGLDSDERLQLAEVYSRWSMQLHQSVFLALLKAGAIDELVRIDSLKFSHPARRN